MGWSWDDYVPFFMKLGGHIDWLNGICLSNSTDFLKSYFGGFLSYVVISPVPFSKDGSGQQNWHHLCMLIMGQSMGQPDNRWLITSWTETSTWWCVLPGDDGDALGKWEWLFHGILCAIGSWVWTWWTMNISPVKKNIIDDIHVMIDHIQPLVGGLDHDFYDFPIILGMSSSQLTNEYIFQRGRYTTNQYNI